MKTSNKLTKKFMLGLFGTSILVGSTIGIATSCGASGPSGFDSDKIGVYVEKEWRPAYEAAVKAYNQETGHKYQIQLKEEKAFGAFEKINTLGNKDSQIADLIYTPLDKVAEYANKQALLPFETPEALVNGSDNNPIISDTVYGSGGLKAFADNGVATVNGKTSYFGIPHNKEALIMFYKGSLDPKTQTFKQLYEAANANKWQDTMVAGEFRNLWQSLGVIAGSLKTNSGEVVGHSLIKETGGKYTSDMTTITAASPTGNAVGLKKAVDFVAEYYATTVPQSNKMLGGSAKNDWLIDGNYSKQIDNCFNAATNAAVIDGPWSLSKFKKDPNVKACVVPDMDTGMKYTQAPGGWLYSINARNFGNDQKINDMKSFINILLTNEEVINLMYSTAGKVTFGNKANSTLTAKYPVSGLEGQVIDAISKSQATDKRPDNGNKDFGNVWAAWDANGFGSDEVIALAKAGDKTYSKYEAVLAQSFTTMLGKLD